VIFAAAALPVSGVSFDLVALVAASVMPARGATAHQRRRKWSAFT